MSKVCVLLGGNSSEREVSLNSGAAILKALHSIGVDAHAFDYHGNNLLELVRQSFDKVVIALHGGSGENGAIQGFFEALGIPYTGSGVFASSICMDKLRSKALVNGLVRLPRDFVLSREEAESRLKLGDAFLDEIRDLGLPLVVKPSKDGSSVGVSIVRSAEEMGKAIEYALKGAGEIMIEEYIAGHELTVAVLNGKALGVCEIKPKSGFYDYEAKYLRNDTQYLVPSTLGEEFEKELCLQAEKVYECFLCSGVARVDFLADAEGKPYFLELNTVPGMTEKSLVPKIARGCGMSFEDLCQQILDSAHI